MIDTNRIGNATELRVAAALVEAGAIVSRTLGDARYDLVADLEGDLLRVQCKTGRLKNNGVICFNTCSIRRDGTRTGYSPGEIDTFGIHCPQTNKVYLVGVAEASSGSMTLRVSPTKNGQTKNVKFAETYELTRL
jgi:hypothetical protein